MKSISFPFFFLFNLLALNNLYRHTIFIYPFKNAFRYYSLVNWNKYNLVSIINYSNTNALQIKYIH